MEDTFYLDDKERIVLEEYHRACLDKRTADKIKAVLLIARGFTYTDIEKILLLDERTLNRYKNLYRREGIDGLAANNYQGSGYKLAEEQIVKLKEELNRAVYPTAEAVCEYVWGSFRIPYTAQGIAQTLHRLGYGYKKAKLIPGKFDSGNRKNL
jgi:transposase